jgi:hypothetical protein
MASRTGWTGRVLIGAVAVMVLVALAAVPSFGAAKKFSIAVTPNATVAGVSTDFTIAITNRTPGNSTINSFSLTPPFPVLPGTLSAEPKPLPKPASTRDNSSATVSVVGSQVRVQGMDSLKSNEVIAIKVTATFAEPATVNCDSPASLPWNATVYAGNSLSGDTFTNIGATLTPPPNWNLTLSSATCIHLQFVNGRTPQDAIQNETITNTALNKPQGDAVQVELVAGGNRVDVSAANAVTLSSTPDLPVPDALTGNTADLVNGLATFGNLKIRNYVSSGVPVQVGGDYTLTPHYQSYPTAPSPSFRIFDALICGDDPDTPGNDPVPYTEDSQATTDGQVTINTTNDDCFAVIVDNKGPTGGSNIESWSVTKSTTGSMQGTLDFVWDLPGTTPVKWTQVTWGVPDLPSTFVDYHDVQLCNPGVAVDDYANLFPTIPGSTYGAEQMCLFSSALVNTVNGWTQLETVAYDTDYGGRK